MSKKTSSKEIAHGLIYISQLSLSVIAPILLAVWLSSALLRKFNLPDWVGLIIILFGFAAGINSAVLYIKDYLKKITSKKDGKP